MRPARYLYQVGLKPITDTELTYLPPGSTGGCQPPCYLLTPSPTPSPRQSFAASRGLPHAPRPCVRLATECVRGYVVPQRDGRACAPDSHPCSLAFAHTLPSAGASDIARRVGSERAQSRETRIPSHVARNQGMVPLVTYLPPLPASGLRPLGYLLTQKLQPHLV